MPINRMKFMNTYLDNVTRQEAIEHIIQCIKAGEPIHVITPNVDQIVRIEHDPYFKKICDGAELLLADGHPLIWIAKWYRRPIKEKICGSDLVPELCEIAERNSYSVFLLGAAPGVAQKAAENLVKKYRQLKVAGTYSPPCEFENNPKEVDKINRMLRKSKADMLFVGLGVPKQDIFIYENKGQYQIPVSFSIGGTIDFIAGNKKRAPMWLNQIGFEWFYRFLQEPRRMFRRYFVDDMKIIRLMWKYR